MLPQAKRPGSTLSSLTLLTLLTLLRLNLRHRSTPNRTDAEDSGGGVDPDPYDPNSLEARAIAAGIDPSLAYLDPSLLAGSSAIAPTERSPRNSTLVLARSRRPMLVRLRICQNMNA
ncbi:hypothetical protein BU15DRAFT_80802 [Melanogaster broomeanus]|nr:hypothetical protein BU15DRAFT_80802 [Melanogaster broomeanus]